jgi:alpha-L-fucosidase
MGTSTCKVGIFMIRRAARAVYLLQIVWIGDICMVDTTIQKGPFEATWESLRQFQCPDWYQDAKFGIFIHWGLYSVPAFVNEWYPRNMYIQGSPEYEHHIKTWGAHNKFGYKDFIPLFKAEKFDPAYWADLFRKAGAKYVMPVAEHHDGFAMYDCSYSQWTVTRMGPRRDILAELAEAVRREGLIFSLSSHRAEHWFFMNGGMEFDSDVQDVRYYDFYGPAKPGPAVADKEKWEGKDWHPRPDGKFMEDWLARTCELVDKYKPQIIYFDWWIEQAVFEPYMQRFAAYYYNRGREWDKGVAINHKYGPFPEGTAVFDVERGGLKDIRPYFWQTDTAVGRNSWCYVENQEYKTSSSLIHDLVDTVSKNGTLLLNIGPRPDGTIPEGDQRILLDIGSWLAVNSEAIHGTRPWKIFGEGPTDVIEGAFQDTKRLGFTYRDIRFTTRGEVLYAIVLGWSENAEIMIESLGTGQPHYSAVIKRVELLGSKEALQWSRDAAGLKVKLPAERPDTAALTLKIEKE